MIDFIKEIKLTDELYSNKTHTYILPVIRDYGEEFVDSLAYKLRPIAYTIGDMSHDVNYLENNYLYITCTMNTSVEYERKIFNPEIYENFRMFVDWVKSKPYYVTEYVQGNIANNRYTFVFSMPDEFISLKRKFMEGSYSKIYDKAQIARLIPKKFKRGDIEYLSSVYRVVTKDSSYLPIFNKRLAEDFGTSVEIDDDRELDYRPQVHQEVLNYSIKKDPYINE